MNTTQQKLNSAVEECPDLSKLLQRSSPGFVPISVLATPGSLGMSFELIDSTGKPARGQDGNEQVDHGEVYMAKTEIQDPTENCEACAIAVVDNTDSAPREIDQKGDGGEEFDKFDGGIANNICNQEDEVNDRGKDALDSFESDIQVAWPADIVDASGICNEDQEAESKGESKNENLDHTDSGHVRLRNNKTLN